MAVPFIFRIGTNRVGVAKSVAYSFDGGQTQHEIQRGDMRRNPAWVAVLLRDPCVWCGGPGGTRDHIYPVALGGSKYDSNVAGACHHCNSVRGCKRVLHKLAGVPDPDAQRVLAIHESAKAFIGREIRAVLAKLPPGASKDDKRQAAKRAKKAAADRAWNVTKADRYASRREILGGVLHDDPISHSEWRLVRRV